MTKLPRSDGAGRSARLLAVRSLIVVGWVDMVARLAGVNRERIVLRPSLRFNGVKVFSATMRQQREQLGEAVTAWIAAHSELTIVDITVAQSSDAEFHCVTIVVFYRDPRAAR